jgi:hypothetical protein
MSDFKKLIPEGLDKLDTIFYMQNLFDSDLVKNRGLENITPEEWIQKETLAIISELAELLAEVNFKWWKNPKEVNVPAVKEELVDILHFFTAMCLKMGMTSVPAQRVLSDYANAGRGISEYVLNIPLDKRKQLWQYLDRKVEEGMNLPYDFLYRGCAITSLRAIQAALLPDTISFGKWDEKFVKKSRRVLVSNQVIKYPWQHFFLQTMVGTEVEQPCAITSKVIIPQDLIDVLQKATLNGQPLLEQPQILATVEFSADQCAWFPTPKMLAFLLLMLAFVSCCYMQRSLSYLFLLLQSLFGIFMIYLVVFSNLPCTNFSWLLIPFNPLPLLFWYWRKLWLLPFGVICSVWSLVMFLQMGNTLVDLAHIVFALALAVNCISQWIYIRKLK